MFLSLLSVMWSTGHRCVVFVSFECQLVSWFQWLPQIKETDSKMAAANSFTVYAGNRLLVVAASSEMEKSKWMEDLQRVIEHPSNKLEIDQLRYGSLKSNSKWQHGCVLFQNLTNLDQSERNAPCSQSNLICSVTSEKIWLSHAHLCCGAPALPL